MKYSAIIMIIRMIFCAIITVTINFLVDYIFNIPVNSPTDWMVFVVAIFSVMYFMSRPKTEEECQNHDTDPWL